MRRGIKSGNNASVTMDEQSCARGRARRGGPRGGRLASWRGRRRATRPGRQSDGKMRRRVRTEAVYANGAWLTNLVVRYVYDGNLVVQERHFNVVAGALVPRETVAYTRGGDLSGTLQGAGGIGGLLARSSRIAGSAGTWAHAYYHSDANGNVTALASASGSLIGRYLYDPFGNTLGVAGAAAEANLYRFSSKEWHAPSGLVYYLYRYRAMHLTLVDFRPY